MPFAYRSFVVLPAALLFASAAVAAPDGHQQFLKAAIESNLAEIQTGQLLAEKAGRDDLKALGRTLVADGNKANQGAVTAAKSLGVTVPLQSNADQIALNQRLAKEPTNTFDTDVVNALLQDEQKAIDAYQQAQAGGKDAAADYAGQQLPMLRDHLATVQRIARAMGI